MIDFTDFLFNNAFEVEFYKYINPEGSNFDLIVGRIKEYLGGFLIDISISAVGSNKIRNCSRGVKLQINVVILTG